MKREKLLHICKLVQRITLVIGALTILLPIVFWSKIPDVIPSHYGASGMADHYSDKGFLIILFLIIAILMGVMNITIYYVKTSATSRYATEAEKTSLDVVYPMIVFMNLAIQVMFAYMTLCSVMSKNLGTLFLPIVLIAVFLPVVYYIYKHSQTSKNPATPLGKYKQAEKQEEGLVYRSKVDWWLGLLLLGSMGYMIILTVLPIVKGEGIEWIITISTLFTVALVAPLFAVKYVFYSEHLFISCGMYGKMRISYKMIENVKETKNPLSSAALSLDRLQIDYVENGIHRMVLISPVRKKEFISKLEEKIRQGT